MAPTLAYDTIELMERYPTIDAAGIQTKTLVVYGGASPAFMRQTAMELSQALPHAELQELQGQGHDVKADKLAPVLAKFLQAI
jgi:hypothetical protein